MSSRMRLIIIPAVLLMISCCSQAHCDDGAVSIVNGGTAKPMMNHPTIRMVNEVVDVKLGTRVGDEWPVFVRCLFEFKNEGKSKVVDMGFPENAEASGDSTAWGRLRSFKSWVDDQPAKIKYLPSYTKHKNDQEEEYKAWYVKKVHFSAGQSRRVVVVYSARLGISNTSTSPDGNVFLFGYTLRTGANWKGLIDRAVINVDTSAAGYNYKISASPTGYKTVKDKFTWTFRNFEPKKDIEINLIRKFPQLNDKLLLNANEWEPCFERNGVLMANPYFLMEVGGNSEIIDKSCLIEYSSHRLKLTSGSRIAVLDGKKKLLTHAPWQDKESDQFAMPLEEVIRLLGGSVTYDSNHMPNVHLKSHVKSDSQ